MIELEVWERGVHFRFFAFTGSLPRLETLRLLWPHVGWMWKVRPRLYFLGHRINLLTFLLAFFVTLFVLRWIFR